MLKSITRRMKIKATMRYSFSLSLVAIIKKMDSKKYERGCGEIKALIDP